MLDFFTFSYLEVKYTVRDSIVIMKKLKLSFKWKYELWGPLNPNDQDSLNGPCMVTAEPQNWKVRQN